MNGRLVLAVVVLAMVGLWWGIMRSGEPYRRLPQQFRAADFETKEPSQSELEDLRRSIEAAAQKRGLKKADKPRQDAGHDAPKAYDAGLYETWVDQELLRRAATGESIPSDGSFDPSKALERLKNGESREDVLGQPEGEKK